MNKLIDYVYNPFNINQVNYVSNLKNALEKNTKNNLKSSLSKMRKINLENTRNKNLNGNNSFISKNHHMKNNNLHNKESQKNYIKNNENKTKNEINKISINQNFEKEILKVFIYIFLYEKILSEKNIFINSGEKYYLINLEWIRHLKQFFSYNKLQQKLESMKLNTNNYYMDKQIESYIEILAKDFIYDIKALPEKLKDVKFFLTSVMKINNTLFTSPGIIFPSKIMDIIINLNEKFKLIQPKKFIFNNNLIYYINGNKIIIGNFLKSPIFKSRYVFDYNSAKVEKDEEQKLISFSSINEYINERKSKTNEINQKLFNEDNQEIGILIIVPEPKNLKHNSKSNVGEKLQKKILFKKLKLK